jgi:curved DNA-binding protein CbpA
MADRAGFDPYAVLGIARGATPLQVARAHRRLAKRFHPDLHPDEAMSDRMRRINDAWRLLSNPAGRAEWDAGHPQGAAASHWGASRRPIQPVAPTTTRTWASWRATAAETAAAPRTRRAPGEVQVPPTRRPEPIAPQERTFRDTGWAAILVAALLLVLLAAVIVAGKLA